MRHFQLLLAGSLLLAFSVSAEEPSARIIGGVDATDGRWPWMSQLAVLDPANPNQFFLCGASLISPHWLITAAHCIELEDGSDAEPDSVNVFIGDTDRNNSLSNAIKAIEVFKHPLYDPRDGRGFNHDLALVQIDSNDPSTRPTHWPSIVSSAVSSQLERSSASDLNDVVTAMGWGHISTTEPVLADTLQEVALDYLPRQRCQELSAFNITEFMVCAFEPNPPSSAPQGQDTCFGDSGGPLILGRERSPWLVGLTSFGTATCASGDPTIYADVLAEVATVESLTKMGDKPLVDLQMLGNSQRVYLAFDQALTLPLSLRNNSVSNTVTNALFNVSLSGSISSTLHVTGSNCNTLNTCGPYPDPLLPGQTTSAASARVETLSNGDQRLLLTATASSEEDDYRRRHNRIDKEIIYSNKPHLVLAGRQLDSIHRADGIGEVRVEVVLDNASTLNAASGVELSIHLQQSEALANEEALNCIPGSPLRCPFPNLAAGASSSLTLDIRTSQPRNHSLALEASAEQGSFPANDASTSVALSYPTKQPARRSSGGGSLPLWLLAIAPILLTLARATGKLRRR